MDSCSALALLAGCSGPVWETVDDQQPQTPVAVWQEEAFEIRTARPEGAELVEETDGLSLYRVAETGLEIEQRVFLAWDKAAAVRLLTGQEAETLTVLRPPASVCPRLNLPGMTPTPAASAGRT